MIESAANLSSNMFRKVFPFLAKMNLPIEPFPLEVIPRSASSFTRREDPKVKPFLGSDSEEDENSHIGNYYRHSETNSNISSDNSPTPGVYPLFPQPRGKVKWADLEVSSMEMRSRATTICLEQAVPVNPPTILPSEQHLTMGGGTLGQNS